MARAPDTRRVLVVEDEYVLAENMRMILDDEGFAVIGPAFSIEEALDIVRRDQRIDAAVVDLELKGAISLTVVDALVARGIPLLLVSAHDVTQLPARYHGLPACPKPLMASDLVERIGRLMRRGDRS